MGIWEEKSFRAKPGNGVQGRFWEGEEVSGWKRILIGNLGGQWGGAGRDFPGKFQDSTSLEMSEAGWEQSGIMGREWDEL